MATVMTGESLMGTAAKSSAGIKYRPEIDGLRAIAVMSVMLYHAIPAAVPGGFLGVDVFFAISGYLITGIIMERVESDDFSVLVFYERRIRRIVPALLVMTALVCSVFSFIVLPDDLKNVGQTVVATILSANNVLLFFTQNYFSLGADFRPLMHTWSLGVEEQYYFVAPFVMLAAYRARRRRLDVIATIGCITLISFTLSLWASKSAPNANFYLIFSRAWELGLGSITTLVERLQHSNQAKLAIRKPLAMLGLVAVLTAMATISSSSSLPAWPTLVPVLGSCLILGFATDDTLVAVLLKLRPLVGLGLISYSTYLYYQPVFVLARIVRLDEPQPGEMLALIPVILLCGWLSWWFVERPFRSTRTAPRRTVLAVAAAGSAVLFAVGLTFHLTSGFYRNWPELAEKDPGFGADQNADFNLRPLRFKGVTLPAVSDGKRVLVIGNSFARDFINMGEQTGALTGHHVTYSDASDCAVPLPLGLRAQALRADFIVLGSGVETRVQMCFVRRIAELHALTRAEVIVLGTKSFGWNNNAVMLLPPLRRYAYRAMPLAAERGYNTAAKRAIDPREYVDILGMLGDSEGRVAVFTTDRKFISQDRRHLTEAGARYVGQIIFRSPALQRLKAGTPQPFS